MAPIAIPTACPVVPPGKGRLNIITTNENAANTPNRGTVCPLKAAFTRRKATYQKGAAAAYIVAHVEGLKYPSGMCMGLSIIRVTQIFGSCYSKNVYAST